MIGRSAGSVRSSGPVGECRTRIRENSGALRVIGSLKGNPPSSNSISATERESVLLVILLANRLHIRVYYPLQVIIP